MSKLSYWLIIFFTTCGVYLFVAFAQVENMHKRLGLDKEVVKEVHKLKGIEGFFGGTTTEYQSGNLIKSTFSLEVVLCYPGILFLLVTPATLIVYRKQLLNKLQSNTNKLIFALICSISVVSLAILATRIVNYTF